MPRRLAQQWMTLSDLEWLFHASHAIFAIAELLVHNVVMLICLVVGSHRQLTVHSS